jgi:pimeloyl-ACP methyl ester carboxylesterase
MVGRIGLAIAAGVLLLLAAAGVVRWALQWRQAQALAIRTPDGIDVAGFVTVNGVPQWVQIRGDHRTNPVLLFVHGGPGFAMSPLSTVFRPWEQDFTMVPWDQRDAGRTYGRNGAQPISLDQVARDGEAVAEYVRRTLPGAPIVVLGHSWGSAVGLRMIHNRPDLFAAYVGTGQMSSNTEQEALSYQRVVQRLRVANNAKGLAELERSGPPPYRGLAALIVERKWLAAVDSPAERNLFRDKAPILLTAPGMSLKDIRAFIAAPQVAQKAAYAGFAGQDIRNVGLEFERPILVIEGDQDLYTPVEPTAKWLAEVKAPRKGLAIIPGGGHNAVLTMPDQFLQALRTHLRLETSPAPAAAR